MTNFQNGCASLITWLSKTNQHKNILRNCISYDNAKTKRLEMLNKLIGLPINQTHYIPGELFTANKKYIQTIIEERGGKNKKHSFRIAPKEECAGDFDGIKKYGLTFSELYSSITDLDFSIDNAMVRVTDFRRDLQYASIIIVGKDGIIGELVEGTLYNLTYCVESNRNSRIIPFYLEYGNDIVVKTNNEKLQNLVNELIQKLYVKDVSLRKKIKAEGFTLSSGYVVGYYEYIETTSGSAVFTDMNNKAITNNLNVKKIIEFLKKDEVQGSLKGSPASNSNNVIEGVVQIINQKNISEFKAGNILVTTLTTVDYIPALMKAKAVVTDQGGVMSHPAIITRELGIPCIVGTGDATKRLSDGDIININTEKGTITVKMV